MIFKDFLFAGSGHLVGFSYHLPSKSYAIFQLPSYSPEPTFHPNQVQIQHVANNNPNPPRLVVTHGIRDVPKLIDKGPLLQIDYETSSLDESNTEFTEDFGEFEDEQDLTNDIELQRVPLASYDPFVLNLPPLMSPEILHGNRVHPEIELQKVPSLGETNTMAIGPPMETSVDEEDVSLKFYDAVPEAKRASKSNTTITLEEDVEIVPNKKKSALLRLRRRRRKNISNLNDTKIMDKRMSKCQYKSEMKRLKTRFPKCTKHLEKLCKAFKSRNRKDKRLKLLGSCLIKEYPKTKKMSKLSPKMLKSGRGTITFDSDEECTTFVHTFFSRCKGYIPTCKKVREGDRSQAKLVLGCLFSNYSRLLIPLMSASNS